VGKALEAQLTPGQPRRFRHATIGGHAVPLGSWPGNCSVWGIDLYRIPYYTESNELDTSKQEQGNEKRNNYQGY
jgi:hypothetical protein